jgi:thiol-disulfide isomerase/thioredoxin
MKNRIYNSCCMVFIFLLVFSACRDEAKKTASENKEAQDTLIEENGKLQQNIEGMGINVNLPKEKRAANYESELPRTIPIIIEGFVQGGAHSSIVLDELNIGEIHPRQSVVVSESGAFRIEDKIAEPGIYQLRFGIGNIHLFLRGGRVKVNTNISNLTSYDIQGSLESLHLKEMYLILNESNKKTYALQDRLETLKKDKSRVQELIRLLDSLNIYYQQINQNKYDNLKKFINRIDTSMVALLAAFYLDTDENYDFVNKVLKKFSTICPWSKFYKQLYDKIDMIVPVGTGHQAPEIIMDDNKGKERRLSELQGKYVILNFWLSSDETARKENVILKRIYDRYRSKGLEIFSVSIDENKESWLNAIRDDKITWIQTCDFTGYDTPPAQMFRMDGIPYNILIDPRGTIISRGKKAKELEKELPMILK